MLKVAQCTREEHFKKSVGIWIYVRVLGIDKVLLITTLGALKNNGILVGSAITY